MSQTRCGRCDGCGKIANDECGTPWSAWSGLPLRSASAVLVGLVRPLPCPDCGGSGTTPKEPPPGFDAAALEQVARCYIEAADDEATARFSLVAHDVYRYRAQLVRDAIAAYQALGDRLVNTTAELRGRIEQLEAQLAWIFRGDVVRNHLPICRADAEAQTAAETEGA